MNAPLSGLTPGTTYYFRVAASNATGTAKGSIVQLHHHGCLVVQLGDSDTLRARD